MPGTNGLMARFEEAVNAFNARATSKIDEMISPDGIAPDGSNIPQVYNVKRLLMGTGHQKVMGYLSGQFGTKPTFTPANVNCSVSADGTHGKVYGTGNWKDNDKDPDGPIHFAFDFQFIAGEWRIDKLWGSADYAKP